MKTVLLGSVAALAVAASASAQSIDYATMQDMFGEPVTLGATGAPQRASEVPATMIIITREDIARFPALDIADILGRYAGVDVDRYTRGQADVSIRGYNQPYNPRLLVLIDGRQVYLDHYAYVNWSALPVQLDEIQQIEVVKGPQAALYGFNAVSGVVNIITRDPSQSEWTSVTASAGSGEYREASGVFGRQLGERFAVRASLGAGRANEFDGGVRGSEEAYTANEPWDRVRGALELQGQLTDSIRFSAEATYAHTIQTELLPYYQLGYADTQLASYKGELEADTDFGLLSARLYRNDAYIGYSTNAAQTDNIPFDNSVTVGQVQLLSKVGTRNTLRFGAEYRHNEVDPTLVASDGVTEYDVYSVSAMWNRTLSSSIEATGAVRFDTLELSRTVSPNPALFIFDQADYDQSIEEFGYNFALVWTPAAGHTVRASTARGVQVPSLVEFGLTHSTSVATPFGTIPVAIAGDPAIEPTIVTAYELAYETRLGQSARFQAALFRSESEDYKGIFVTVPNILPPAAPTLQFLFSNQGDTTVNGLELSLEDANQADAWRWRLSATALDVEDDLTVNQVAFVYPVDFEVSTPSYRLKADLGWTQGRWSVDGFASVTDEHTAIRQTQFGVITREAIDSQIELSARAAFALTDQLTVEANAAQLNYGGGERVNAGPELESRVWASVTASF